MLRAAPPSFYNYIYHLFWWRVGRADTVAVTLRTMTRSYQSLEVHFSNLWFQKVFTGDVKTMSLELVCLHEDIHGVHDLLSLEYSQRRHCPSRLVQTPVRIPAKCFWFQMWNVELGTVIRIRVSACSLCPVLYNEEDRRRPRTFTCYW